MTILFKCPKEKIEQLYDYEGNILDSPNHFLGYFNILCNLKEDENDLYKQAHSKMKNLYEILHNIDEQAYFCDTVTGWYHNNQSCLQLISPSYATFGPLECLGLPLKDRVWLSKELDEGTFSMLCHYLVWSEETKSYEFKIYH